MNNLIKNIKKVKILKGGEDSINVEASDGKITQLGNIKNKLNKVNLIKLKTNISNNRLKYLYVLKITKKNSSNNIFLVSSNTKFQDIIALNEIKKNVKKENTNTENSNNENGNNGNKNTESGNNGNTNTENSNKNTKKLKTEIKKNGNTNNEYSNNEN